MITTVSCAARGVPCFSMIHDSYAVHAEYVPTLADSLRTAFCELYHGRDLLSELASQWRATGAQIADPPRPGEFNVEEVRSAKFFFS
jgi:DNA-directed RNA polymerase